MQPSSKINPNALCSCDSGKKYKQCCGAVDAAPKKSWKGLLIPVVAIVGTVGFLLHSTVKSEDRAPTGLGLGVGSTGGGGLGQVWSQEHGHYHDATTPASAPTQTSLPPISTGATTPTSTKLAVPPAVIPEGQYWDPTHGHLHGVASAGAGAGTNPVTLPVGATPVGTNTLPVDTSAAENN